MLRDNDITIPVATVHHWGEIRENPVLCEGDFVGANAQSVACFDPNFLKPTDQDVVVHITTAGERQTKSETSFSTSWCPSSELHVLTRGL